MIKKDCQSPFEHNYMLIQIGHARLITYSNHLHILLVSTMVRHSTRHDLCQPDGPNRTIVREQCEHLLRRVMWSGGGGGRAIEKVVGQEVLDKRDRKKGESENKL